MSEPAHRQTDRPLLIVVSDSAPPPAALRLRTREVRRWCADDEPDAFHGDPTDPATFAWTQSAPGVTAVIDMGPPERARAVLKAFRSVRSDAAVLVLSSDFPDVDRPGDGTLIREGRLRDVLRVDVEEELQRLEDERRAYCLRRFAAERGVVPILIHEDPDPDAVSSALAVSDLLGAGPERHPIVTLDDTTRPENRRMAELLHIRVTRVTIEELRRFERVITVDTQPRGLQRNGRPRVAVIDHHPPERDYVADFADIRPRYGATATMLTEYLRTSGRPAIASGLATALLFGIRTDTDSLRRHVTPADVTAYAYLQRSADTGLLRRFEKPSYTARSAHAFGRALTESASDADGLMVASLGELSDDESHVLADLADFGMAIENVTWMIAAGRIGGALVLTIRHAGMGSGAGALARALAGYGGTGGGHVSMARATIPEERVAELLDGNTTAPAILAFVRRVLAQNDVRTSRRGLRPARPA